MEPRQCCTQPWSASSQGAREEQPSTRRLSARGALQALERLPALLAELGSHLAAREDIVCGVYLLTAQPQPEQCSPNDFQSHLVLIRAEVASQSTGKHGVFPVVLDWHREITVFKIHLTYGWISAVQEEIIPPAFGC